MIYLSAKTEFLATDFWLPKVPSNNATKQYKFPEKTND
jgi:hypothetical protein